MLIVISWKDIQADYEKVNMDKFNIDKGTLSRLQMPNAGQKGL